MKNGGKKREKKGVWGMDRRMRKRNRRKDSSDDGEPAPMQLANGSFLNGIMRDGSTIMDFNAFYASPQSLESTHSRGLQSIVVVERSIGGEGRRRSSVEGMNGSR